MVLKSNVQQNKLIKILIEIGILLFAVGIAWATLGGRVGNNTEKVGKHEVRIKVVEGNISTIKSDIRDINTKQTFIVDGIKEIKESLKK